jgi:RNA polymerase sigma factor (sigma-70 family)
MKIMERNVMDCVNPPEPDEIDYIIHQALQEARDSQAEKFKETPYFEKLFRIYYKKLVPRMRYKFSTIRDQGGTALEIFVKIWHYMARFDEYKNPEIKLEWRFTKWFNFRADSLCLNAIKKQESPTRKFNDETSEVTEDLPQPDDPLAGIKKTVALIRTILTPKEWEIYFLRFFEGYKYKKIATILNMKDKKLYRLRKKIKNKVAKFLDELEKGN